MASQKRPADRLQQLIAENALEQLRRGAEKAETLEPGEFPSDAPRRTPRRRAPARHSADVDLGEGFRFQEAPELGEPRRSAHAMSSWIAFAALVLAGLYWWGR